MAHNEDCLWTHFSTPKGGGSCKTLFQLLHERKFTAVYVKVARYVNIFTMLHNIYGCDTKPDHLIGCDYE